MRLLILLLLLGSLAPTAVAQQVFVVDLDGGAGVDFTSLQLAVDAAADGDFLLVRESASDYTAVAIDGRSLTILAEPQVAGQTPTLPNVLVRNLAASDVVTLRGFAIETPSLALQPSLWIREGAGAVFVEDCEVSPLVTAGIASAIVVANSTRVVLNRVVVSPPPVVAGGGHGRRVGVRS